MTLGQQKIGAYDGFYAPATLKPMPDSESSYSQTHSFINYNKVEKLLDSKYNLSPRFRFCDVQASFDVKPASCLMAIDFAREREIDLGRRFPF